MEEDVWMDCVFLKKATRRSRIHVYHTSSNALGAFHTSSLLFSLSAFIRLKINLQRTQRILRCGSLLCFYLFGECSVADDDPARLAGCRAVRDIPKRYILLCQRF